MTPKERMEMKQRKAQEDAVKKGLKPRQSGADLVDSGYERDYARKVAKNTAAGIHPDDPTKYRDKRSNSKVWKDVNDWRDVQNYRVPYFDRNDEGSDSCLVRIMIPKQAGHEVMNDVARIEEEIGAFTNQITYVEGVISGETGADWAVDFTVRWDQAWSVSASDRFKQRLVRNIENTVDGIRSVKLV